MGLRICPIPYHDWRAMRHSPRHAHGNPTSLVPHETPGKPKNNGVGSLSLLQANFLTQKLNQGLLHCRQIPYQLSHQLPRHDEDLREPLVRRQGSQVSMRVARGSASCR